MYTAEKYKSKKWKQYKKDGFPLIFVDKSIDDFEVDEKNRASFISFMEYYNNAKENMLQGKGLLLCGPVGVGKTFLMTKLADKAHEICINLNSEFAEDNGDGRMKYNRSYFIHAGTLAKMVFTTGLDEQDLAIRKGIRDVSCLFIDDISKMGETKNHHELSYLDELLRYRYYNGLTTFYTSQLPIQSVGSLSGLDTVFPPTLYDIIRDKTMPITLIGKSKRGI